MTNWRQDGPKVIHQYLCPDQKGVQGVVIAQKLCTIWQPIHVMGEAVVCHLSNDALMICPVQRNCAFGFAVLNTMERACPGECCVTSTAILTSFGGFWQELFDSEDLLS